MSILMVLGRSQERGYILSVPTGSLQCVSVRPASAFFRLSQYLVRLPLTAWLHFSLANRRIAKIQRQLQLERLCARLCERRCASAKDRNLEDWDPSLLATDAMGYDTVVMKPV